YANVSAQPEEGPDTAASGEAQEETDGIQEPQQTGDEAGDSEVETGTEDEAGQTKGAQAEGVQTQEAPPEEWAVPGRFPTWDDLLKSYDNAQKQLGRLHREVAQLRREGAPP